MAAAGPWTSREAAAARRKPARLAIGDGVMAMEMATAFAGLGAVVTLLARDGVLPTAELFADDRVTEALQKTGLSMRLGADTVHRDDTGTVRITLTDWDKIEAGALLVAICRRPKTEDVGLDSIGLTPVAWLTVDEAMTTDGLSQPGALAVCDVPVP